MRALFYFILGAILLAVGIWWITVAGASIAAIGAALVTALGASIFLAGWAVALDMFSPTSKRI